MHGRQEGCVETKGEGGCMADKRDVLRKRDRGMHGRQEGCVETKGETKKKGVHEGCMGKRRKMHGRYIGE